MSAADSARAVVSLMFFFTAFYEVFASLSVAAPDVFGVFGTFLSCVSCGSEGGKNWPQPAYLRLHEPWFKDDTITPVFAPSLTAWMN